MNLIEFLTIGGFQGMDIDFSLFNWWAILVSTLLGFIIGGIWYGPLFGKAWMKALGKTEFDLPPSVVPFVIALITAFVSAVVLAYLISVLGATTWLQGAMVGLVLSVAFIACSNISDGAYCRWSWSLVAIHSGYRVLYCILMGVILAIW